MVPSGTYNFESDDEDNINGYELSDLSDVFTDDEDLISEVTMRAEIVKQTAPTAAVESLSLDDIPYDRDVKWMNVPTSARVKTTSFAPNRFLQQVQSIVSGNSKELEALDKQARDMDLLKKHNDNKTLFELPTPVRGDRRGERDIRRRRDRDRDRDRERRPRDRPRGVKDRGTDHSNDDPDFDRNESSNINVKKLFVTRPVTIATSTPPPLHHPMKGNESSSGYRDQDSTNNRTPHIQQRVNPIAVSTPVPISTPVPTLVSTPVSTPVPAPAPVFNVSRPILSPVIPSAILVNPAVNLNPNASEWKPTNAA